MKLAPLDFKWMGFLYSILLQITNSENRVSTRDSWEELCSIKTAEIAQQQDDFDFNCSIKISKDFDYFLSAVKHAGRLENFGAFPVNYLASFMFILSLIIRDLQYYLAK